jgi:hypothetical protein
LLDQWGQNHFDLLKNSNLSQRNQKIISKIAGPCYHYKKKQDPGGICKMHLHPWEMMLVEDGQEWHRPARERKMLKGEQFLLKLETWADLVNICVCRCLITSNRNN